MIDLINQLEKAYNGAAWHGNNILSLLSNADPSKVFSYPIANTHSIAEITLHLTVWTEEVTDRVNGLTAKEPIAGDWPQPKEMSVQEWEVIVNNFKAVNNKLILKLKTLQTEQWSIPVKDERDNELSSVVNNAELINGLIQHHAYHDGQIAIMLKF